MFDSLSPSARFILVLSTRSNTIRAALVTRELVVGASAHQTFALSEERFDPAEVWYKLKQVAAACLDIGRTLPREIAGIALLTDGQGTVEWNPTDAGFLPRGSYSTSPQTDGDSERVIRGTLADWLFWNLTGTMPEQESLPSKTLIRAPFQEALPIVDVSTFIASPAGGESESDRAIVAAAQNAWRMIPYGRARG
jgi:hypothetical protein